MKSSEEYPKDAAFALMLIGTPKAGKTVFATSFPKPYILDCDNNLGGAKVYHGKEFKFSYNNPQREESDPTKRWTYAMKCIEEAVESDEVKTIIVDGLSVMAQYLEQHILANSSASNGMKDLIIAGEKVMNMQQWGPFKNLMTRLVMACKSSGKRFIMTCHEDALTSESGAIIAYRPLISGSLKHNIAGFFSDVWRCETEESAKGSVYRVRFKPRNMMQIGNSIGFDKQNLVVTGKTRGEVWKELEPYLK